MKYLIGAMATLILLAAAGFGVVWTGAYDVAATDPHADPVRWALDTTLENSVERRSRGIAVPASFGPERVKSGFSDYDAMCAQCHGAPGVEPAEWAPDMRPSPPSLSEAATHWQANEVFWILRHGIKMSGMPALGPTHSDEDLWAITAFVEQLPEMSPEAYAALREKAAGGHHGDDAEGGGTEAEGGSGSPHEAQKGAAPSEDAPHGGGDDESGAAPSPHD